MMLRALIAGALLALLSPAPAADADALGEATTAEIEYLLERVSACNCTFIRNGDDHPGAEAADHMRRKFEHFLGKGNISSTEDFIDLAGTKSLLSGKPYKVRLDDGREVMTADWLRAELAAYRTVREPSS